MMQEPSIIAIVPVVDPCMTQPRKRLFASTRLFLFGLISLAAIGFGPFADKAFGAEINVMISGGFSAAFRSLTPGFEQLTAHKLVMISGPSMGSAKDAIPVRLQRGEDADVVIMVGAALDDLINKGQVIADSRVDLATSAIGMAVRTGEAKPDIASVEAFRRTLLEARTIAYSDSASGVYISNELFNRLGITEQMKGKRRSIPGEAVGTVVARGQADIGFQQISELLPIKGIEIVGTLPSHIQQISVFSAGIATNAKAQDAARELIRYFSSPAAFAAIKDSGLQPISATVSN